MSSKISEKSHDLDHQLRTTPVAIIGMASIFPQARNLPEYWDNILNKINCITDVPADRWETADYYDPDPSKPDKSYCKRGGFIPDIDFDLGEFGLPPNILEVTDISQLLSLVVARDALEDAGFNESKDFDHLNTGVILGAVGVGMKLYVPLMARLQYPVWERVLKTSGVSEADTQKIIEKIKLAYVGWEENSFPGSLSNVIAGRIANRFDLGGTNCVLDAACATSMAAIKMAIMELVEHRANMMITGGVDTDNSIGVYMSFSKTPAFSKGDAVRTFDAENDGMMAGEGIGMLVLKRLADAERDGDRIYAVIRGVGSSSDGRFKSIYAPRPSGQAIALRRAYEEAGYSPSSVGLIEAHGTGTPAGDPAEFQGLREAFDTGTPQVGTIALGSVKSQIAHTKGAAGSAGMIKVALALHHKVLPPTINVNRPNPKLGIEHSSFYINSETRPWFRRDANTPRRGGVSAFGFGGTNFHITLEEYQPEHQGAYRTNTVTQAVLLSAPTVTALQAACQEALSRLASDADNIYYNLLVNQSENAEIPAGHARIGFVAGSAKEAQELMQTGLDLLTQKAQDESWEHPKGIYYRKSGMDPKGKLVALFSGQGSQYLEMGRELACNFPTVRQVIGEMDNLFVKDGLKPLSSRIYPPPVFEAAQRDKLSEDLTRTEHAQPAIGAVSVALYKLLQQAGFAPDFVAGHSFGELTALWAAGVLNDLDYYTLAKARGKAMSPPEDPNFDSGAMLAVKGDAHKVKEEIREFPEITLANWNSDNQIVLAGSKPSIASVQKCLAEKGYSVVLLPVSAAFHTPLVGHAQKPFARVIDSVAFNPPAVRLYSNTSGKAHSNDPEEIRKVLKGHILNPVLFKDEIENIYAEGGYFFIEFGPKSVLTNLVKNILGSLPHLAVALNASPKKDSDRQFREAVVQLRVAGLSLKNIDPFQLPRRTQPGRKKSLATVKLNGGAFVSPKTRAAFEKALQDGFKVSSAAAPVSQTPAAPAPAPAPLTPASPAPATTIITRAAAPVEPAKADPALAGAMEHNLAGLREQQNEVTRLHQQYLRNEEEYTHTYARLSEQEMGLLMDASPDKLEQIAPIFESLERSMARFHDHQAETLRVHAQYLKSQEEYAQNFVRLVQQQFELMKGGAFTTPLTPETKVEVKPVVQPRPVAAPVIERVIPQPQRAEPAPAPQATLAALPESAAPHPTNGNGAKHAPPAEPPAPAVQPAPKPQPAAAAGYDRETLTCALLAVVSEKTGYPVEMLELSSDMEADLGIDSIKRVEIMGALREQFHNLPKADPEAFAEVRTLGQTVDYIYQGQPQGSSPVPHPVVKLTQTVVAQPAAVPAPAAPAVPSSGAYTREELAKALLAVVSEKTGYPVEMLELSSDMEADLGIDSIKRVEIMGALREQFPNLPPADPEAFAEVRTLGQTVDYMTQSQPQASQPAAAPVAAAQVNEPASISQTAEPIAAAASAYDPDALSRALLAVVSEKTGYPVEMLELGSDMEADLGIDSIKRVEIMGALREQFPNLPQADPEAFAEARTLGNVVDYLTRSGSLEAAPAPAVAETSLPTVPEIPRGVVSLKSLPEPDNASFNLPDGSVCLVTDNGNATTAGLAQALTARGWRVVVLSFPETLVAPCPTLPEGIRRVTLADMSEEHLQAQLASIAQQDGPIAAVVHLNPVSPALPPDGIFSGDEKEIIKHVFLLAKHLKEPLTEAASQGSSAFLVVVSLDGEFGLGNQIDFDPISGGLFGLVKTLNLEWEAVYCRALDVNPEISAEQTTRLILAELYDPNRRITEVGYSARGRATLVVEQAEGVME